MKKRIIRLVVVTAIILAIPLIAMQFTEEVNWTLFDFVFATVLIMGTGLTYEFVARRVGVTAYRVAVGIILAAMFLLIWVNGAVGIIGNEDNPANLLYGGVLLTGLIGAIISGLKPLGMARTAFAMATVQFLVPIAAVIIWRPDFSPGIVPVFFINAFFVIMLVVSGLLFRHAGSNIIESY